MNWSHRWGYSMRPTEAPGVCELRDGGYLIHGKVSEAGRQRRAMRVVRDVTLRQAVRARIEMLAEARPGPARSTPLFSVYAPLLYERKVLQRDLKSAKTRERWDTTLTTHLLPAFGRFPVDAITKLEIESWKVTVAKRIAAGKLSPRTANGWLSILRGILRSAVDDYGLERDPTLRVRDFPTAEHPTYTEEEPNSLSPEQCHAFLEAMHKRYPQHYAMVLLGFVTGLRPSTLRALRRRGTSSDVLWKQGTLLVRRSNSLGAEVMNTTKTETTYKLALPPEVMAVLRAHADALTKRRARSLLLFPATHGGFLARSALDKPFAVVAAIAKIKFTVTPRAMRRTYQDLGRAAGLEKKVRKAVCGHASDEASDLYETVRPEEMRAAVSRILGLATGKTAA